MEDHSKSFWAKSRSGLPDSWPKDAGGEPEQAAKLTLQSELGADEDITISMLQGYGIPAFKDGTLGKVIFGFAGRGVEIYVPASRLSDARELLAAASDDGTCNSKD